MKLNFQAKGIVVSSKQKRQMERKIMKLKRYVKDFDPITIDLTLLDESGPERGGIDQAVHINVILPGEKIYIEETDDRIMRAFNYALKTLDRRLRRFAKKNVQDKRRKGRKFKALVNVVGAPARFVGSAGRAVGKFVPKKKKKK